MMLISSGYSITVRLVKVRIGGDNGSKKGCAEVGHEELGEK